MQTGRHTQSKAEELRAFLLLSVVMALVVLIAAALAMGGCNIFTHNVWILSKDRRPLKELARIALD